jgi:hypothetical protein
MWKLQATLIVVIAMLVSATQASWLSEEEHAAAPANLIKHLKEALEYPEEIQFRTDIVTRDSRFIEEGVADLKVSKRGNQWEVSGQRFARQSDGTSIATMRQQVHGFAGDLGVFAYDLDNAYAGTQLGLTTLAGPHLTDLPAFRLLDWLGDGVIVDGYWPYDPDLRLPDILTTGSLFVTREDGEGGFRWRVRAKNRHGTQELLIDPKRGYLPTLIRLTKTVGDACREPAMWQHLRKVEVEVDLRGFEQVGSRWLASAALITTRETPLNGDPISRVTHYNRKSFRVGSNVTVSSLSDVVPEGTPVYRVDNSGVEYVFRGGRIVPAYDPQSQPTIDSAIGTQKPFPRERSMNMPRNGVLSVSVALASAAVGAFLVVVLLRRKHS